MAQEERRARFVEISRIGAQREVDGFGCWKLSSSAEHAGCGVDFYCGFQQSVLDNGMKIIANHQTALRADEDHVRRRLRFDQIDSTGWQHQFVQVWINSNKGIGSRDTFE